MTATLGGSALQVALAIAIAGVIMAALGARRRSAALIRAGYAAAYTTFGLVALATVTMVFALVVHDFSVSYVAQVGSESTPLWVTLVSLWSALEGSILFWAFVLAGYTALIVRQNRTAEGRMVPFATATLLGVLAFFLLLLIGPANPFHQLSPAPMDGPGPNPLLQNHIMMAVHPPLLYIGYVGLTVPFAFAVGAMLAGELNDDAWIDRSRTWTLVAWGFLTAAIIAGMWWSYEVLGWGGYWAWDPVENASLMPWLSATAFTHSVIVQKRRGMLRVWNLSLVVATFLLTILGTFLTRSGVLSSVHAFTEGTIGWYFMGFIALVLIGSMALVAGTAGDLRAKGQLDAVVSRESVFLGNNLVLSAITFTVLLGTLFPLVAEALNGTKVSVGKPFFNGMAIPLALVLVVLMGIGPALPWRRTSREAAVRQLIAPSVAAVVMAVLAVALGARHVMAIIAYAAGGFAVVANLREFWIGTRARMTAHHEGAVVALGRLVGANRHRYGGYVAHLGIVLCAMGIAASSASTLEHEATLKPGDVMHVGAYTLELKQVWGRDEPQRFTVGADVIVRRGARVIGTLTPAQNFYRSQEQPIPTPSVRSSLREDVYLNLMAFTESGSSATVRALVEPLVVWIWLGGGVLCLGALVAVWPTRRRAAQAMAVNAPVAAPAVSLGTPLVARSARSEV